MSAELEEYRSQVAKQVEALAEIIGRLRDGESGVEVPSPAEGSVLAPLFHGLRTLAKDLDALTAERDRSVRELEAKLELIQHQSQAILELSTPVIEVWDEILVVPLIGTIDTERAGQIIESLLEAIVRKRAAVVILDITGVPVVDTKVAQHFIKTVDAARILGARAIVTGVSPANAQTLVRLGIDLSRMTTKNSLQAGLKLAFELTDNRVAKGAS